MHSCYEARSNLILITKNKMPSLVANLQGILVGLGISGSGSIKRKETWRQQFESAPGYFYFLSVITNALFGA